MAEHRPLPVGLREIDKQSWLPELLIVEGSSELLGQAHRPFFQSDRQAVREADAAIRRMMEVPHV